MDPSEAEHDEQDQDRATNDTLPLLREGGEGDHVRPDPPLKEVTRWQSRVLLYFMAIHFLLAFCEIILVAPLIRLFENSLCLNHYQFPAGGVEESRCKIPEIQRPLATIRGWKSMFDTIPVLLVAIPIGRLGDRYGGRKVLALAMVGVFGSLIEIFIVCAFPKTFPLQLVWLSSAILLFGGGLNSASAFMWAMASNSIPSNQRSHGFYYIFSAFYIAELISSFLASVTIDTSPWIPCGLAMGSIILCLFLLAFVSPPEIRNDNTLSLSAPSSDSGEEAPAKILPKFSSVNVLLSALSKKNIRLTIPVFLVGIFRYAMLNMLIQYASFRFALKISTGATFYTETAIVNILLFLFFVPWVTKHIRSAYHVHPQVIDLFMVRTSVCLMCCGCLVIGLAQASKILPIGVFILASGFGSRVSALALISYWMSDNEKTTLYAAIIVLESIGHAIGDPAMQQILAASLQLPPFWTALPFFVAAGFYLMAATSASFIRIEKPFGHVQD